MLDPLCFGVLQVVRYDALTADLELLLCFLLCRKTQCRQMKDRERPKQELAAAESNPEKKIEGRGLRRDDGPLSESNIMGKRCGSHSPTVNTISSSSFFISDAAISRVRLAGSDPSTAIIYFIFALATGVFFFP